MATEWKSQRIEGKYYLQFETDDKEKYKLIEKAVQLAIDGKTTVEAEEVKHGEWKEIVEKGTCFEHTYYICSNCGVVALDEDYEIYCHHCGAKMDGRSDT